VKEKGFSMYTERNTSGRLCEYLVWNEYRTQVIASACVELEVDGSAVLHNINVSSGYRGNGVGTELLSQILADFSGSRIIAYVFEGRAKWYERHGFRRDGNKGSLVKVVKDP
jgi:N-acetylglutamate synthase-like GNAT family acetyltransferase